MTSFVHAWEHGQMGTGLTMVLLWSHDGNTVVLVTGVSPQVTGGCSGAGHSSHSCSGRQPPPVVCCTQAGEGGTGNCNYNIFVAFLLPCEVTPDAA